MLSRRRAMMASQAEGEDEMREWKLVADYTIEETTGALCFDKDAEGNPFEFEELIIMGEVKGFLDGKYFMISANKPSTGVGFFYPAGDSVCKFYLQCVEGRLIDISSQKGSNPFNMTKITPYGNLFGADIGGKIKSIYIRVSAGDRDALGSGSHYIIYGR